MSNPIRLVCGLGNPGRKYEGTRHNIGYLVLDRLAADAGVAFRGGRKFPASTAELRAGHAKVVLLKSDTFMNDSGIAVGGAAGYHGVAPEDVLVVQDDIDLPFGVLRFRRKGSSGGHRGVQSIEQHLRSREFHRLKVGVASPLRGERDAADFVLDDFSAAERAELGPLCARTAAAVLLWAEAGIDRAMEQCHGRDDG